MESKGFTNFYIRINEENWLDFLFVNEGKLKDSLFYDGLAICFINTIDSIPGNFIEVENEFLKENNKFTVEGITREHWTSIIKFSNGCLIRTVFLSDDEDSKQRFIVVKPLDSPYKFHLEDYTRFKETYIKLVENEIDVF